MAHRRHGNGRIPTGNGDPFRAFVVNELVELRTFREEQARQWRIQDHYWKLQEKKRERQDEVNRLLLDEIKSLSQATHELRDGVSRLTERIERVERAGTRQERVNRLVFKRFRSLRHRR